MTSVLIYYTNQCDKKKCTSIKIRESTNKLPFTLVWSENQRAIRRQSIVLTPNSTVYLLPSDRDLVEKVGITILDCSWKQGGKYLKEWTFGNGRILPPLIAGNPVNYGKWHTLTSLEALAASFFIVGLEKECFALLELYNWGMTFFEINKELLDKYKTVATRDEIIAIYNEFVTSHKKNQNE